MKRAKYLSAILFSLFLVVGCEPPGPIEEVVLDVAGKVSACGGFTKAASGLNGSMHYCDSEKLLWSYDAIQKKLSVKDLRVSLNCCGGHYITMEYEGGIYRIIEKDRIPANGARCKCMCVYDFSVDAKAIPQGIITVELVREVEMAGGVWDIDTPWMGTINLSAGSGLIVVNEASVMGCHEK